MIDLQKMIILAMKNELFPNSNELNMAASAVLAEMKTKYIDIKEEITNEIQYKMLQKMKKDRENSVKIYLEAYEKSNSDVTKNNLEKAKIELEPINLFLLELEAEMPKKLNETETEEFIKALLSRFPENPNKEMLMKLLKAKPEIDMATVTRIVGKLGI